MKTTMAFKAIKNMVFSAVVLLPLQLNPGVLPSLNLGFTGNNTENSYIEEVPPSAMPKVVLLSLDEDYCDIECFLESKKSTLEFMSKTFKIKYENIYNGLLEANEQGDYDEYNIGALKDKNGNLQKYNSFEEGLIEYLFNFAKKNPRLVSNTRTPYAGKSDYVVDLIKYFTSIYTNVDYTTAVSIGAAESGYYQVKYMLKCNNVFGGMGKNGLIKYKNIEYGTLSYIRMLSKNYYGKGLNTVQSIGRVYCPTYDANGNKIASPHWVNLVNKAKTKYNNTYEVVKVEDLLDTKAI